MRKIVFTGLLCFLISLSFGQKKAVSAAKNEIKNNPPNLTEARNQIKGALTNPETANDAETWYVAGQIENKQFDTERIAQMLGKQPNEEVMYSALEKILPYFEKAAALDQLPDAKGKVKPRFLKDIRAAIRINRPFYINAGIFAYDKKNYQKAYEDFKQYGDIPNMDMFKEDKWIIAKGDTTEMQFRYYAGVAASNIPDPKAAIAIFEDIKNTGYVPNTIFKEYSLYRNLGDQYLQVKDSVKFEKLIKEGFIKFPGEEYFMTSLFNLSLNAGKSSEAIEYLNKMIEQHPDSAQYYDLKGQLYDTDKKTDEAVKNMQKAIELDPKNIEYLSHLGRVYFNLGVEKRTAGDTNSNAKQSEELLKQSTDYFKQAMPYFEKVFEADNKNSTAIFALRSIYYTFRMNAQYEKMDALYNKANGQ